MMKKRSKKQPTRTLSSTLKIKLLQDAAFEVEPKALKISVWRLQDSDANSSKIGSKNLLSRLEFKCGLCEEEWTSNKTWTRFQYRIGTTRFLLNSECFEEEESKEDKHQIWLSFRSTDRGLNCQRCNTKTHGTYSSIEMERLAIKFVDHVIKGEETTTLANAESSPQITPLKICETDSPKVTKIMSTLDTTLKSKFNRKNPLLLES